MAERRPGAVLDTDVFIDPAQVDRASLPDVCALTTITLAELQHGIAVATDGADRDVRTKRFGTAIAGYAPCPSTAMRRPVTAA